NNAGTFYWQAAFSGDANNEAATSLCSSEKLTVSKATATTHTSTSDTASTGMASSADKTSFTGLVNSKGTGTVTYTAYSDSSCSADARGAGAQTVAVAGLFPYTTLFRSNNAGTFYWQAAFSGDANNEAATSLCSSEKLTVSK